MGEPRGAVYSFQEISSRSNDLDDVNKLLAHLSSNPRKLSDEDFRRIKRQANFFLWAARDKNDRVVAMASLIIYESLFKKVGIIEDVVVDIEHRGKGLAKQAMHALITFAKVRGLNCIELTSNPAREIANRLYLSLGFQKRDTNYYRLNL